MFNPLASFLRYMSLNSLGGKNKTLWDYNLIADI